MNLNGSETILNLARAFSGESQARNRYNFYAEQLLHEGYYYLHKVISEIAHNEHAHAKVFFRYITDNENCGYENIQYDAGYPFILGKSVKNLEAAAQGEMQESTVIYPKFAETARKEGFAEIAASFDLIGAVESHHNKMFERMRAELQNGTLYKKANPIMWKCENCGHMFSAKDAPAICPLCSHPIGFFETPIEG